MSAQPLVPGGNDTRSRAEPESPAESPADTDLTPAPGRFGGSYSNAPPLHRNVLLGTLQLLAWLLFHPSAWRSYLAQVSPPLAADFCLSQLTPAHWRDPALRRLLFRGHVVAPLLASTAILVEMWALGVPAGPLFLRVATSLAVGIIGGLVVGSGTLDAVGMTVGVIGSISGGAAVAVATAVTHHLALPPFDATVSTIVRDFLAGGVDGVTAVMVAFGIAFGSLIASVGGALASIVSRRGTLGRRNPLGLVLVGTLCGGIFFAVALGAAVLLPFSLGIAAGGLFAGAVAAAWLTRSWVRSLVFGVLCAIANYVLINIVGPKTGDVVIEGSILGVILGAWFSLPYVLASEIGGPLAGSVAGALGVTGGWLLTLSSASKQHLMVGTSILPGLLSMQLGVIVGLTQSFWRPLLLYPLQEAWNLFLYRADQSLSRPANGKSYLRWHAAFWDELQRWPLLGLDEHLLLVLERDAVEGSVALERLAGGPQRWAVQAVQLETDARRLSRCLDAESIGQAHRSLGAGELEGPASALLRSLRTLSQDVDAALAQSTSHNQRLGLSTVLLRLQALIGDLTRSPDRHAGRFRPIALSWRQTLQARMEQLASDAEERQELDNPYVIGVPLTPAEEIFVGRTDISARIEQLLLDRRRHPLLLYGQRRMGKTSLLNNLGHLLPSTIVPLFVDLQGPASRAKDHAGLLYNLARAMIDSARKQRELVLPPLPQETLDRDPFTGFDEWLDRVELALGERTALLAFDELEALDQALAAGRFSETEVLGMLRHLIQHRPRFKTLLATSRSLAELERWSSYLINVQVVQVGYLKDSEARRLIERPVKNPVLRYAPEATEQVLALTRGHPFLVQLLCAEIVELKNEQDAAGRRLATKEDVLAAVPEAVSHGSFFFADIERNQVDAQGLLLLRRLATRGEGQYVTAAELRAELPVDFDLDAALAPLRRRDLIEEAAPGFRFQIELIRRYFTSGRDRH